MNKIISALIAVAFAGLFAGAAQAGAAGPPPMEGEYDWSYYFSENASVRISGAKCDTLSERRLYADLSLHYDLGPNAGVWNSSFFGSFGGEMELMVRTADVGCDGCCEDGWEIDGGMDCGCIGDCFGPPNVFTAQDEKSDLYFAQSWYDYEDFEYGLMHFGLENCDGFEYGEYGEFGHEGGSFRFGETEVDQFSAVINKRRSTASVRMRGWSFWDDFESDRVRKLYFDYRARMNEDLI